MNKALTPELIRAVEIGSVSKVEALLNAGADPNAESKKTGVLHTACLLNYKQVVALLLKYGAKPNVSDRQDFYPLHLAATKGHTVICNTLLKWGADINAMSKDVGTALHIAASTGHARTLADLLKTGCDVNLQDKNGNTPLIIASALGNKGTVRSLIKAGADVNIKNSNKATALVQSLWCLNDTRIDDWVYDTEKDGLPVRYELKKGCFRYYYNYKKEDKKLGRLMTLQEQADCAAQAWAPQAHLRYLDALDVVKQLLKAGAKVNVKSNKGISPLRIACFTGVGDIIKLLFKAGATLDEQRWNGLTELHHVAGSGRLDGLEMFFKFVDTKKVNVNALDPLGWTAAHYLADTGGPIEMANLLREQGVDLSIVSQKANDVFQAGVSASDIASYWDDPELAFVLNSSFDLNIDL